MCVGYSSPSSLQHGKRPGISRTSIPPEGAVRDPGGLLEIAWSQPVVFNKDEGTGREDVQRITRNGWE